MTIGIFAVLILFDLVGVNRRYVNTDNFVSALQVEKPYRANAADKEIMEDNSHFRVWDISSEGSRAPAKAAYFHNSLNGYHAAKLRRFDDLYEFHISRNNMNVLNMLNTKYIIAEENGTIFPFVNKEANGNAWFISELEKLDSQDSEIKSLDSLQTTIKAVTTATELSSSRYVVDSTAVIQLIDVSPNHLKYQSNNANEGFAVFSEMYYGNGWMATIDGKEVPIQRVNYALRGLEIPAGQHDIEFKFEPQVVQTGSKISLASSVILGILILVGLWFEFKKKPVE